MPTQLFLHCASGSEANDAKTKAGIDIAARLGIGIQVNYALSSASGIAANTTSPTWTWFDNWFDYAVARLNKIPKIRIRLGGGPPIISAWTTLAGSSWSEVNRPPAGTANAVWAKIATYNQAVIDRAISKVKLAGKQATEVLEIQLGGEPAKKGAEGPWTTANPYTYSSPYSGYSNGTWDEQYHAYLAYWVNATNFRSLPVLSPALLSEDSTIRTQELATIGSGAGANWRSKVTRWAYHNYNYTDSGTTGATYASDAFEAKHELSQAGLQALSFVDNDAIPDITEFGWTPEYLRQDDVTFGVNPDERGEAIWNCYQYAKSVDVPSMTIYTAADDDFGLIKADLSAYYSTYRVLMQRLRGTKADVAPNKVAYVVGTNQPVVPL